MNKKIWFGILFAFIFVSQIGYANELAAPTKEQVYQIATCGTDAAAELCDCNEHLYPIIIDCIKEANIATKQIFKDFDQEQYTNSIGYAVSEGVNRFWYNGFLKAFNNKWKTQLKGQVANRVIELEEYARIAAAVRHYARVFVRYHTNNLDGLVGIQARDLKKYGDPDGPSFDWLVSQQLEKQKKETEAKGQQFNELSIDEGGSFNSTQAYWSIIKSSTKTNKKVNAFMKCYDWLPSGVCDWAGSSLASAA